jgi:hypothetical protein
VEGTVLMKRSILVSMALLGGCESLAGLNDDYYLGASSSASGGSSSSVATSSSGNGGSAMCRPKTYPLPPVDPPMGGALDMTFAVRLVRLGDVPGTAVGFDLDDRCTCDEDPPSCIHPDSAKDPQICDLPGGVDANLAKLIESLAAISPDFSSAKLSDEAEQGLWSFLIRVSNYNGELNDGEVRVAIYSTPGNVSAPKWDGTDVWSVSQPSLIDGGTTVEQPRFVDPRAYVTNGQLVASLPDSDLAIATGASTLHIRLVAAVVVADIVTEGGSTSLRQGVVAGRWRDRQMFEALGEFRKGNGTPLCTDETFYQYFKALICTLRDVTSAIPTPTTPCDSMSAGIGFEAYPVVLGPVKGPDPMSPDCPDNTNPKFDECL